jgi:outer membrane protein OmpA-like peptidoglycan-associated protein
MRRFFVLYLALLFLSLTFAYGQKPNPPYPLNFGIWGALNGNFLSTDVKFYYSNGTLARSIPQSRFGAGWGLGGIINIPISKNLVFTGRLGYNSLSQNLNFIYYDYATDSYTTFEDVVNVDLAYLEITPGLLWYPMLQNLEQLYFLGAIEFGSFTTKNISNSYLQVAGEIPNVKSRFSLTLGAGWTLPISSNIYLTPEVSFRLPLTKVSDATYSNSVAYQNETISLSQLRFGLNLTFSIPTTERYPEPYKAPTGEVGFKEIVGLDRDGKLVPVEKIRVEDTRYQEYFPIVPYVFFQENQAVPAPGTQVLSTVGETGEFTPERLPFDALEINRRTLDIVGWRLKNNPRADLTVVGTIDNSRKEKENKNLAMERANFVKNYLVKNWNINPQRINTRAGGFPSKPSTTAVPEGVEENRRAELSSSNPDILAPLLLEGENQRIAEPWQIQFIPYANVNDSIAYWEIDVYQGDNLLKKYNGTGQPQTLFWTIKPNELTSSSVPVDYSLLVETAGGKKYKANGSIPTEYFSQRRKQVEDLPDKTITKFSLVLFDFDKADVSPQDQDIINKLIIPAIKYNSTVKIYGYTDRIGDDEYNLKLATRRAEAVKSIIQKARKDVKIETYGVGERQLLFDNDIPTGRHLSRTVQILIVTPK